MTLADNYIVEIDLSAHLGAKPEAHAGRKTSMVIGEVTPDLQLSAAHLEL